MRELKRSIARHLMKLDGIEHMNKKLYMVHDKNGNTTGKRQSFFARHWREYLNLKHPLRQRVARKMKIGR